MRTAAPGKPAKWSAKYDKATLDALRRGEKRLVVIVETYKSPRGGVGELIVTLTPSDKSKHQELSRIGIHPNMGFDMKNKGVAPKRFLMPREDFAAFLDGDELRLEIGFPADLDASSGGSARIDVDLVDQKPK